MSMSLLWGDLLLEGGEKGGVVDGWIDGVLGVICG